MKRLGLAIFTMFWPFAANAAPMEMLRASDFDWISGHWCIEDGPEHTEEFWLPARGGMLMGMSRSTRNERTTSFEFLRIVVGAAPAYMAQPDGRPAVAFRWTAGGTNWARFENPAHDFPTRIEYRRDGDHLHAQIFGPGGDGKENVIRFDYERCGPSNVSVAN